MVRLPWVGEKAPFVYLVTRKGLGGAKLRQIERMRDVDDESFN